MAPRKKQERRKPGSGTIRHKKGRALPWETAFPLDHGQYRYDSFSTRAAAETHLDTLTAERDSVDAPRNITGGSQLVKTFLPAWLETKRDRVRPKTFDSYRYYCELADGQIGSHRIDEVSREKADSMLSYFYGRGFQNVEQLRSTLRQAFEYALEEEYIRRNPFAKARAPHVERRKAIVLTQAQRNALIRTAAGTPLCGLWHLYSRVGLRRGEGIGLLWDNINWEAGTITITQQYTELNGKTIKSLPKTKRSGRTIPIPPNLLDILKKHREWQRTHAMATPGWQEHGLVFCTNDGTPWNPTNLLHRFKQLLKAAGLSDMTIHDLRHTAEYRLEQDGAPLSVRMALLGHSTAAMAGHYSDHADLDAMRQTVQSIA